MKELGGAEDRGGVFRAPGDPIVDIREVKMKWPIEGLAAMDERRRRQANPVAGMKTVRWMGVVRRAGIMGCNEAAQDRRVHGERGGVLIAIEG